MVRPQDSLVLLAGSSKRIADLEISFAQLRESVQPKIRHRTAYTSVLVADKTMVTSAVACPCCCSPLQAQDCLHCSCLSQLLMLLT